MESGIARVIDMNSGVEQIKTHIFTAVNRERHRRSSLAKVATLRLQDRGFLLRKGGVGKTTMPLT